MKFTVVSDLHLEFAPMDLPGGDNLLLSGDILLACDLPEFRMDKHSTGRRERFRKFIDEECSKYQRVFMIAGNHEHYHHEYTKTHDIIREFLKGTNVTFLERESAVLSDDVVLWGATLWTNYDKNNPIAINESLGYMNDYRLITVDGKRLTPQFLMDQFHYSLLDLGEFCDQNKDKKIVVMTHHSPSYKSIHPRYGHTPVNFSYCSALEEFILDRPQIKVWTHGHTHDSYNYMIRDTNILCNPRGYHSYGGNENRNFDEKMTFEV